MRSQHRDALNAELDARFATDTSDAWVERLNKAGVPCGPIYAIDQMFADPQVKHLGVAESVSKKPKGSKNKGAKKSAQKKTTMRLLAQPVSLSRTPSHLVAWPPEAGEHTDAVLAEFGFSRREIKALHAAKAV